MTPAELQIWIAVFAADYALTRNASNARHVATNAVWDFRVTGGVPQL